MGRPRKPPVERIAEYGVEMEDGCVVWVGALTRDGYGKVTVPRDRVDPKNGTQTMHAHRLAWELECGPIPEGMTLDHLCRNRACIRISHLEVVTVGENIRRGEGPAAKNARKTHCQSGHPLAGENLYLSPEGYRYCRTCRRRWHADYLRRQEALR